MGGYMAAQAIRLGANLILTRLLFPEAFGLVGHLWDGKLLSEHLRQRYGVALGVRQCQRIFGQMGFRLRKPRPQVAQSDPVKVAAVKKTAPPGKTTGH